MRRDSQTQYWHQQQACIQSMFCRNNDRLHCEEKQELLDLLPDLRGKKILDLASGIGRFTREFSSKAQHVTSVDFTPHFVEKNRKDHRDCLNVKYICSDVRDLQINDGAFDFVFFNWLCMYLEDNEVAELMKKIHRWLKPKGELFFRESCALVCTKSGTPGYVAHYRTQKEYDRFLKERFSIIQDGQLNTYIYLFGDPFQSFWYCNANSL